MTTNSVADTSIQHHAGVDREKYNVTLKHDKAR